MKKTVLILSFFVFNLVYSVNIVIPDANFKATLVATWRGIDTNGDGEIQDTEAEAITSLIISGRSIASLQGIEAFTNLTDLDCSYNSLSSLDLSTNTALVNLDCSHNAITGLDLSNLNLERLRCNDNDINNLNITNNTNLKYLYCFSNEINSLTVSIAPDLEDFRCNDNNLTNIDVSNNSNLIRFYCGENNFNSLDVSSNPDLIFFYCDNNPNLDYINLKNGNNPNLNLSSEIRSRFYNLPQLETVCVDTLNTDLTAYINSETGRSITYTEYCTFTFAQSNTISGSIKIDLDLDGCDALDATVSNILITADNGTESYSSITKNSGLYEVYTDEGTYDTTITTNLPSYFVAAPTTINNTFTGFNNTFTADFCITPDQVVDDVNISIIPITEARPGFNTFYKIVYQNIGTTELDGNITITFDNGKLSFIESTPTETTQTTNSLTFDYVNLKPFDKNIILLKYNVLAPPTTNVDDILSFTADITPSIGDYTVADNTFSLNQTVIGSYDPNDITCLQGDEIPFEKVDDYLHYIIRFQNKGTADAINIVVKNVLDNKLDWSTLQLETASHSHHISIKNGNDVEFIFENIHLIDSATDEPNSHGYIAYKIKPKNTVVLNDVIKNQADIFFDYNEAVVTNVAESKFVNILSVKGENSLDFSIYPSPTNSILNISSKTSVSKISIYSKLGKLVLANTNQNSINLSNLTQGLYFCKVEDINGNFGVQKIVKK